MLTDIPGYPGRIAPHRPDGSWLAIFAPRSQLVEFVLREPRLPPRMMREIEPEFWVAPSLHPIARLSRADAGRRDARTRRAQAVGAVALVRPGRASRREFDPLESFHSRADGRRHGITSASKSTAGFC